MDGPPAPISGGISSQQSTPVPAISNFAKLLEGNKPFQEDPQYTPDIKDSQSDAPTTPIKGNGMSRRGQLKITPRFGHTVSTFLEGYNEVFPERPTDPNVPESPPDPNVPESPPDPNVPGSSPDPLGKSTDATRKKLFGAKSTAFDQGVQITPMAVALGYGFHLVPDDARYVFSVNGVVKVLTRSRAPSSSSGGEDSDNEGEILMV